MAKILLTWEFGGGLGHVARLLKVADALAAKGYEPILALKDVVEAAVLLQDRNYPIVQAPFWHPRQRQPVAVATYPDILAAHGFGHVDELHPMTQAWARIIELTKPAVMICDYSPTACLAGFGELPIVQVSNGFCIPPVDQPIFPSMADGAPPKCSQKQMFNVIREVQQKRNRREPKTLCDFLATAGRFIMASPQLDAYRHVRREPMLGPIGSLPAFTLWPDVPSFFGYFADSEPVTQLLEELGRARVPGEVFIRRASPKTTTRLTAAGLRVHSSPQPLDEVFRRVSVVVHHGSLGIAEASLAAGRIQVMVPVHLEHKLNAEAVQALGVGKMFMGDVQMNEMVRYMRASHDRTHADRSQEIAETFHRQHQLDGLDQIVEACAKLV